MFSDLATHDPTLTINHLVPHSALAVALSLGAVCAAVGSIILNAPTLSGMRPGVWDQTR